MPTHIAPENDYRGLLPPQERADVGVTVVIPVYNRVGLLARTVAALAAQDHPAEQTQVVVADDGSEEDVQAALEPLVDRLDLRIVRREHDGYGAGQARNLGASAARGEVLVFVDADCVPDSGLVSRHARWHVLADNLVVIGSRHPLDTTELTLDDLADGRVDLVAEGVGHLPGEELGPSDWRGLLYRRTARLRRGDEAFRALVSSNFSVRRQTFAEVGGFDESFTRWGGEDTELGWRLFADGCFVVPDDEAVVFHQVQEDAGEEGWRGVARHENDGVIRTKIPHRFYRKDRSLFLHEVPKVSVVVGPVDGKRAYEVFADLRRQSHTDWTATFVGQGQALTAFGEEATADPRVEVVRLDDEATDQDVGAAISEVCDDATGEYVTLVHGAVSLDHRMLGRAVRWLDQRPRSTSLTVGYRLPGSGRSALVRRPDDVAAVDTAWRDDGLPMVGVVRRREWRKHRRSAGDSSPWLALMASAGREHLAPTLVGVPGAEPTDDLVAPSFRSPRSVLVDELRASRDPRRVATATARFVRERAGRPNPVTSPRLTPAGGGVDAGSSDEERVPIRYVGWTGHDNLGDEALFDAITGLMPWADLSTSGAPRRALMLGGGTLVNRGYLGQLDRMDSPRIERVVFGTGVANPDYWGTPREDPADWLEFLSTCGYVGVRGPMSAQLLRAWGWKGQLEVVGDPALAIGVPSADRVDGRVVVAPARTRGELWGGDDEAVVAALAALVKELLAEGRDVHVLSCHPGDDGLAIAMMRRAGAPDLPWVPGYRSTAEALQLLASASTVVGERLHALVLAAACGVPFVGLEYRPKVRDFARSVGAERWVLRTDELDGHRLRDLLYTLDSMWGTVADEVASHVTTYRRRLDIAAGYVRELTQ